MFAQARNHKYVWLWHPKTSRRTGNRSYFSHQVASSVNVSRPYLWWPWDLCTTRARFAIAIGGSRSWESYLLSQTFAHTGNLAPNLDIPKPPICVASNMCASSTNVNIPKPPICVASNMCASSRNVIIPPPHPTLTIWQGENEKTIWTFFWQKVHETLTKCM